MVTQTSVSASLGGAAPYRAESGLSNKQNTRYTQESQPSLYGGMPARRGHLNDL